MSASTPASAAALSCGAEVHVPGRHLRSSSFAEKCATRISALNPWPHCTACRGVTCSTACTVSCSSSCAAVSLACTPATQCEPTSGGMLPTPILSCLQGSGAAAEHLQPAGIHHRRHAGTPCEARRCTCAAGVPPVGHPTAGELAAGSSSTCSGAKELGAARLLLVPG